MNPAALARRGWVAQRELRRSVRHPVSLAEARRIVAEERRTRGPRFLHSLDRLAWPYPASPARRLLEHAGLEPGDVRRLVQAEGLEGALERLRDAGVYVSYEEYQGTAEARRGSAGFSFSPPDFFNPVTRGDYMAATGGSRSAGTPMEISFAWLRRQGLQRALQYELAGVAGAPAAIWLPVFPSAAGFGAIVKTAAGGQVPERWFSQIPAGLAGVPFYQRFANRLLPALNLLGRTGLPSPEHVPSDRPEPVVRWLADALARAGRAAIAGYASSLTAAARYALEQGVDLTGAVAFPSSEPVTAGKLAAIRRAGMRAFPTYAFVPEGTVALSCPACAEEEYHLWEHELGLVTRRRPAGNGGEVSAFLWTSLSTLAPRVLLNVENDDYGTVTRDRPCACPLGALGLTTRLAGVRGLSKVVSAGISLEGRVIDDLVEVALPARLGGGPGDYQLAEHDAAGGTRVTLRVHPRLGPLDPAAVLRAVEAALAATDVGALTLSVWSAGGGLRVVREPPAATRAGKTLSFERLGAPAPAGSAPRERRADPA